MAAWSKVLFCILAPIFYNLCTMFVAGSILALQRKQKKKFITNLIIGIVCLCILFFYFWWFDPNIAHFMPMLTATPLISIGTGVLFYFYRKTANKKFLLGTILCFLMSAIIGNLVIAQSILEALRNLMKSYGKEFPYKKILKTQKEYEQYLKDHDQKQSEVEFGFVDRSDIWSTIVFCARANHLKLTKEIFNKKGNAAASLVRQMVPYEVIDDLKMIYDVTNFKGYKWVKLAFRHKQALFVVTYVDPVTNNDKTYMRLINEDGEAAFAERKKELKELNQWDGWNASKEFEYQNYHSDTDD